MDQYPLFSQADEALWSWATLTARWATASRTAPPQAYTRIVRDYPLSAHVDAAKEKLAAMNRPVPQPDPVAYARMKYELENRENPGMMNHFWGIFKKSPDTRIGRQVRHPDHDVAAARPCRSACLPRPPAGTGRRPARVRDVSVSTVQDSTTLDSNPDARQPAIPPRPAQQPGRRRRAAAPRSAGPEQRRLGAPQPLPTNHQTAARGKTEEAEDKTRRRPQRNEPDPARGR